jgi:diacylglycerol kinase (ATP)
MHRRNRPWNVLSSLYHAYSGLLWVAPRTPSLKAGMTLVAVLVGLGFALRFTAVEIALLVLGGTLLLAIETLNTAVEILCDFLHPEPEPVIGKVKDVAAAASAFCEIGGGVVLLLILVPHVLRWLGH